MGQSSPFWLIFVSQVNTVLKYGAINCKLIVMWHVAEARWPDNQEPDDLIGQFHRTDSNILEKWTELGIIKNSTSQKSCFVLFGPVLSGFDVWSK